MKHVSRMMLVAAISAAACGDDSTAPAAPQVVAVELRAPNDSLFLGKTMQLYAVAIGDSAAVTRPTITWSSSDTLALVVSNNGFVTAVGTGTAVVTAAVADQQARFTVRAVPMRVAPDGMFATAATSAYGKNCALTPQGHVACLVAPTAPDTIPRYELLPDATNHAFTSFSSGNQADCGLKADGSIWCTRRPSGYLLATGASLGAVEVNTFLPVQTTERFAEMVFGVQHHLCGIGSADGLVRCWGDNYGGALGRPGDARRDSVVAPVFEVPAFRSLATGFFVTCGVDLSGRAICWGSQARGREMRALPDTTLFGSGNTNPWYARVRDGAPAFVSVTSSDTYMCGLTAAGEAHCWGANGSGQLGIGTAEATTSVQRALSPVPLRSVQASVGRAQVCALSTTDDLYCWGTGHSAPLNAALSAGRYAPRPFLRGIPLQGVTMSPNNSCVVTRAGGAICW